MGYTQNELLSRGQAKGVGVSFVPVGNATLTLKDLVATGYGDSYADGGIYAKKLNGYGVGGTAYYWFDISDPEVGTLYGWYNDEGSADYNSVELDSGEGLWVYSPSTEYKIQSSGQVPASAISVALRSRGLAKMVSNPTPVTLTLGEVTVTGYGDSYADGGIYAKKLNGYGVGGTAYYWFDISDPEVGTLYGWYNDEGSADYNSVELTPGEGLWIYSSSDSYSVVFPAPEL